VRSRIQKPKIQKIEQGNSMGEPEKESVSQVITIMLSTLGFVIDPLVFAIALCVSVGASVLVSRERPEAKRRPFWSALLAGLVVSVLSGMISAHFFPSIPVAVAMVLGGLSSSFVLNIYVGVMTRIEDRTSELTDALIDKVLPTGEKGGDE
jgi:4-hydroxybenzoate polyprenyltransferase